MEESKIKRTWVYLEQPATFEMAGCACGNENTQWSEYQKHLWCDKCKIDFIPKHNGMFDSPIPLGTIKLMGITFHRLDLKTQELQVLTQENDYIRGYPFKEFNENTQLEVVLKDNSVSPAIFHKAYIHLNPYDLRMVVIDKETCPNKNYKVELPLYDQKGMITIWSFNIAKTSDGIRFNREEETSLFCKWLLAQKFDQTLATGEEKEKPKL